MFIIRCLRFMAHRYVTKFVRKYDRMMSNPDAKYTNLYMKNLDTAVGEEILREKFSQFGKIISLVISRDENGTSKGFGFVNFDNPDDARRAVEAMNGSQLGSLLIILLLYLKTCILFPDFGPSDLLCFLSVLH